MTIPNMNRLNEFGQWKAKKTGKVQKLKQKLKLMEKSLAKTPDEKRLMTIAMVYILNRKQFCLVKLK